ncbi:MAG TPA: hypothetical protein VG518_04995 [Solirubrobacterales bacterium]|nr:hypothetical protein [Solirubrobacterales bacterium]
MRAAGDGVLGGDAIPGDSGAVEAMASRLRNSANEVGSIQHRIGSVGLVGSWSGQAAGAFKSSLHELPGELSKLHSSFDAAAGALASYASALSDAQSKANWYARQIEEAESDLQGAQQRHSSAQSAVDSARRSHMAASDPVSKASAQRALDSASGEAARASAAVEEISGKIDSLRSSAHTNHEQWEAAASACCSGLDAASHLGIRNSVGSWFDRNVTHGIPGKAVGAVASGVAWTFREGEELVEDVGHWAGRTWDDVGKLGGDILSGHLSWADTRAVLEDAKAPLIVAGIGLTVAAVVLTDGAATPLLVAEVDIATAGSAVATATALDDVAIGVGDSSEAIFGDTEEKRGKYRDGLLDDATNLGTDLIGVHGAHGSIATAQKDQALSKKAAEEMQKYRDTGRSGYKGWATRYQNQMTTKGDRIRETAIDEAKKQVLEKGVESLETSSSSPQCPAPTIPHEITLPSFAVAS